MPPDGYDSISVQEETKAALNRLREARGQAWDAFLRDAATALESEPEGVTLDPASIDDIATRTAREVAGELQGSTW